MATVRESPETPDRSNERFGTTLTFIRNAKRRSTRSAFLFLFYS